MSTAVINFSASNNYGSVAGHLALVKDRPTEALRRATDNVGSLIESEALEAIPKKTGRTASTIQNSGVESMPPDGYRVRVYSTDKIAKILEDGSVAHIIAAKNGKALRFMVDGREIFRREVRHPGTPPYLWLSRAIALSRGPGRAIFDEEMRKAFEEMAAQL